MGLGWRPSRYWPIACGWKAFFPGRPHFLTKSQSVIDSKQAPSIDFLRKRSLSEMEA